MLEKGLASYFEVLCNRNERSHRQEVVGDVISTLWKQNKWPLRDYEKKKKINLKQGVVREGGRDKIGTLWELYAIRIRTGGTRGRKLFVEFVWTYSITSLRKWTHPFGGTPQTGQEKAVGLAKLRAENISDAFHYKTKGAGEFCCMSRAAVCE